MQFWSLCLEDTLDESMATHSSILAWRIPWTEEPGGLQSMGLQIVGHDWSNLTCNHASYNASLSIYPTTQSLVALIVLVTQSCLTLCNPKDCSLPGSSVQVILQARILEWVAMLSSRGSSQPRSPTLQLGSLPAEPPGKPKNTGVGSLSLLQRIFLTQEVNQGLLHCR